jgi:hypothetical protein
MIAVSKNRTKSYAIAQKEQQDLAKLKRGKDDVGIVWKIAVSSSGDVRRHLRALEHLDRVKERSGNKEDQPPDSSQKGPESGSEGEDKQDGSGTTKKSGKKRGKDATDKNLSEAVRSKITNQTAVMFAGGSQKSWMIQGMEGINERSLDKDKAADLTKPATPIPAAPKPVIARGRGRPPKSAQLQQMQQQQQPRVAPAPVVPPRAPSKSLLVTPSSKPGQKPTVLTAEQYYKNRKVVTVRDAVFCLERERVTGAKRGRAKGWKEILNRAYATRLR